jgi:hypothetical protein
MTERDTKIVMRHSKTGRDRHGATTGGDSFFKLTKFFQDDAEVTMCDRKIGLDGDSLTKSFCGFIVFALANERDPEIQKKRCVFAVLLDRSPHQRNGLIIVAFLLGNEAEQMQRGRVPGINDQQPLQTGLCVVWPLGPKMAESGLQQSSLWGGRPGMLGIGSTLMPIHRVHLGSY